jgi:ribosomal-protein-alanine N-acetyltransferase
MGRAWWRQGLCAEAVSLLVTHAFATAPGGQGMRRLEAQVNPDNLASNRLLGKLDFIHEGCLRQRWISKGQPTDTNFYGLLRHDWATPDHTVST